jgi:hypothetical protein
MRRLLLASPRRGEVEAGARRRLRVRGFSTHSYSRKVPSPAAHLTMRVDLSPAGRGEKEPLQLKFIML